MKKFIIIALSAALAALSLPALAQNAEGPEDKTIPNMEPAKVIPIDRLLSLTDHVLAVEEVRLADIIFSDGRGSKAYESCMDRYQALQAFRKEVAASVSMAARYTSREHDDGSVTIRDEKTGEVAVTLGKNKVLWYNPIYKSDTFIL